MSIIISGGGGGGGATTLNGLSDVNLTSLANGQIIAYNNTSGQWENQTGITGGLTYQGSFNATTGAPSIANALQGDFYVISVGGTLYGQTWVVGDHLLINADMGGVIDNAKIDKVDNTDQVVSVNTRTGAVTGLLDAVNNLSDLVNVPTARTNLGLGTAATSASSDFLAVANNLSDLGDAATARTNLGLGTAATSASSDFLAAANNLSDVANAGTARTNLGLGTAATSAASDFLAAANNLSDLGDAATARTNLGLGTAATSASSDFLAAANNLSDVANAATARTNLGLGTAATAASTDFLSGTGADTLGGNLDVGSSSIVSSGAADIAITPDTTGSIVLDGLNWPQADGTTGQVIQTNGAGQLSFVDQTTGLQDVVDDTTPQLGGNLDVNGQSIVSASAGNIAITPDTTGSIILDGLNWPQADGTTGQVIQTNGAGQLSFVNQTTGLQDVVDDTTPQLGGNLDVNGQSIVSASAGNIAITPDTTGSIILDGLSWPQADGSADQVLKTNGAGQLSFVDQGGASRPTVTTDPSGTDSTISNPAASVLEDIYLVSNGASAVNITLPTVTSNSGYKVQIKRLGTANVTVTPASGTIDGAANQVLTSQFSAFTCTTDGTNWFII